MRLDAACSYAAGHKRVSRERGAPTRCEACELNDPGRVYHWASLTGDYGNPFDYRRLCVPCHRRFDTRRTIDRQDLRRDNKTGVRGVQYRPDMWPLTPFRAVIKLDGKQRHLGLFTTLDEASDARHRAEMEAQQCV